ncbi:MAG: hypothetical protein ABSH34_26605 [Verrucomicrobiota bacterium]|jgi:hypothetical protein
MIQFEHLISEAEVNSQYINLTDANGKQYGPEIGQHGSVFAVIDGSGREFRMKRHHGNQLTRCSEWFSQNAIRARTAILVKFDRQNSVLHMAPVTEVLPLPTLVLGAVSFAYDGRQYEVRCTLGGSKIQVRGFVDGDAKNGFDL